MFYHPFRNLGLKFLSVVIAVLLWLTVAGEQVVERSLGVPLELVNTPAGLELVGPAPQTVLVRLRGSSSVLSQIDQGAIVAVLNVETARPRQQYFHLTPADVHTPFGVEVLQVSPGTVPLGFEETATKTVAVQPDYQGQPAEGFVIASVSVVPQSVTIEGPASAVRLIDHAVTELINLPPAKAGLEETVTIRVNDPLVRLQTPQSARVMFDIRPAPVARVLAGVRVGVRNGSSRPAPSVVPAVVSVEVRGPAAVVGALTLEALPAFADLAGLRPGRYNLPVRVEPPPEVEVVRIQPARVSIRIR